jgi:amino-acid N-acetyltransferase
MKIRKAVLADVPDIQKLINYFAGKDWMLPRSLNHLYENIRDYYVAEEKGGMVGCAALHIVWGDLGEVNSLAVCESHKGKGTGRALVRRCIAEARALGIRRVFALTYVPKFFKKCGFSRLPKSKLPQKIWSDCLNCHKFPDCGEVSVAMDLDVPAPPRTTRR